MNTLPRAAVASSPIPLDEFKAYAYASGEQSTVPVPTLSTPRTRKEPAGTAANTKSRYPATSE